MPSCMIRGSRVEPTLLKLDDAKLGDAQKMGLVCLKVLNVSQRNWPVRRSVNFMFLNSERSVRQKPGARMAPGRSVVSVVCVADGTAKAATLNQLSKV